jgi:hypothetical protein
MRGITFGVVMVMLWVSTASSQSMTPATSEGTESNDQPTATFKTTVVGPVSALPALLLPLYTAFIGLEAADGYYTWAGVRRRGVEVNPVVAYATGNVYKLLGLKMTTSATTIYFAERLRRAHPLRALVLMAGINGALSWVVWHDTRVIRTLEHK